MYEEEEGKGYYNTSLHMHVVTTCQSEKILSGVGGGERVCGSKGNLKEKAKMGGHIKE